jgi:hypothetical protein
MYITCDTYVKIGSARKVRRRLWCKFQDVTVQHREPIYRIVNKQKQTGSLLEKTESES